MACTRESKAALVQCRFSVVFNIHKKSISHMDDEMVALDVRHIFCFDSSHKIVIKIEDEKDKIFIPEFTDFGGARNRSRLEAIIIQEVTGERLTRAGFATCLKSHDGINAFNTLKHRTIRQI